MRSSAVDDLGEHTVTLAAELKDMIDSLENIIDVDTIGTYRCCREHFQL